jgi:hypothetical protein
MDALIVVGIFVVLAVVAPRLGYDSRGGLRSEEQNGAIASVRWRVRAGSEAQRETLLRSGRAPRPALLDDCV